MRKVRKVAWLLVGTAVVALGVRTLTSTLLQPDPPQVVDEIVLPSTSGGAGDQQRPGDGGNSDRREERAPKRDTNGERDDAQSSRSDIGDTRSDAGGFSPPDPVVAPDPAPVPQRRSDDGDAGGEDDRDDDDGDD